MKSKLLAAFAQIEGREWRNLASRSLLSSHSRKVCLILTQHPSNALGCFGRDEGGIMCSAGPLEGKIVHMVRLASLWLNTERA